MLVRITAPHFTSGIIIRKDQGKPNHCAPIIRYMRDWDLKQVEDYCQQKGWQTEVMNKRLTKNGGEGL